MEYKEFEKLIKDGMRHVKIKQLPDDVIERYAEIYMESEIHLIELIVLNKLLDHCEEILLGGELPESKGNLIGDKRFHEIFWSRVFDRMDEFLGPDHYKNAREGLLKRRYDEKELKQIRTEFQKRKDDKMYN